MTQAKVLAGFHAITARARHAPTSIEAVYVDAQRRDKRMTTLIANLTACAVKVHPAEQKRLQDLAGSVRHQGVVALAHPVSLAGDLDEVLNRCKLLPYCWF